MSCDQDNESHCDYESIGPFDWLTSAVSLEPILHILFPDSHHPSADNTRALHVGCGSSTVGEYLVTQWNYAQVVNVDIATSTLEHMKQRWEQICEESNMKHDRLVYRTVDLSIDKIPYPPGYFDVVFDKSTLDCTLCSDEGTAGLLCQVYRSLNPHHGVYVLISFHHIDMLLPLMRDCPGTDWTVEHKIMYRQVEDLNGASTRSAAPLPLLEPPLENFGGLSSWANGSFEPTEEFRKTLNVLLCRRNNSDMSELDRDAVRDHVHVTNNHWYGLQNPMLTGGRKELLQQQFRQRASEGELDLTQCYEILFTAAERGQLSYDYFLEDWNAFLETRPLLRHDGMTLETAEAFMNEMQ